MRQRLMKEMKLEREIAAAKLQKRYVKLIIAKVKMWWFKWQDK